MLVLTRKLGERIVLPSCEVTITVTAIAGNRVHMGISAPLHVKIHREEVWKRVQCDSESELQLSER
jgi:carbon storage regulator